MTASHATAIGANGKGLKTYITGLMQEYYSSEEPENYDNEHMKRGRKLEDSAAFMYQMKTNLEVKKVGFVEYSEFVGCSPDLFVFGNGMAEIKCPADKVYFQYLIDGKVDSKYLNQIQMQMLLTDRYWCDYVIFNTSFEKKICIKRIEPDYDYWDKLKVGFKSGEKIIKEIEDKITKLYHENKKV